MAANKRRNKETVPRPIYPIPPVRKQYADALFRDAQFLSCASLHLYTP
jgi:hypothetical protein